jgi:hypothetical protein
MSPLAQEILRTLCALLYFIVMAMVMVSVQVSNDNHSIETKVITQRSLPDVVLDSKHRLELPAGMPDWALLSFVLISMACHMIFVKPRTRLILTMRRFFWLLGSGYGLRALSLLGTVLPPSNPNCQYRYRTRLQILLAGPQLMVGAIHTCSDKIFSGHTIVATLVSCFWWNLTENWLVRCYPIIHELFMILCSLNGRHHYTVDIVVALIVAVTLFHLYHLLVRIVCVSELTERMPLLPVGRKEDSSDGAPSTACVFSKYPAKAIRLLIKYIDGIDLRTSSDMLTL